MSPFFTISSGPAKTKSTICSPVFFSIVILKPPFSFGSISRIFPGLEAFKTVLLLFEPSG